MRMKYISAVEDLAKALRGDWKIDCCGKNERQPSGTEVISLTNNSHPTSTLSPLSVSFDAFWP